MRISDRGLDLIKAQEGYHTKQQDGSCRSYRCPAGVWTCGWGSTVGVGANTHWTRDEATEALRAEMATHEEHVQRLVTVPLLQGQFDGLVSLCYNIGAGALGKSTLLRHLNAGDSARAASHFTDFKRARVSGATARLYKVKDGTSVVLAGLVTRRAAEAALFLEAMPVEMAQKVEPPPTKMRVAETFAKVGAPALAAGAGGGSLALPAAPDLSAVAAWRGAIMQGQELMLWGAGNLRWVLAAGAAYLVLGVLVPKWAGGRT
jgi:lysozyme